MSSDLITWLRARHEADPLRLTTLASERAGMGRPDDRVIKRIAMDQVSTFAAQKQVICG
ncbi:hypothetical protein [Paractinoplanes toevensis]|uniref:Uncharacterized protein n=1 Tax=Paractinoplanes toevensis TaxID=571911 RepID=A0A919TE91_9ACTN|nr:hypothetical protein [Actinoplanes toevensis]GIM94389.1 hypothetical protein Ato02nite_061820 [Actinoplanes toevensis]